MQLKTLMAMLFLFGAMYAEDVPKKQEPIMLTAEQQAELLKLELRALKLQAQAAQTNEDFKAKEAEICKGQKLAKNGENWVCVPATPVVSKR